MLTNREKTCCFTGHRKLSPKEASALPLRLGAAIEALAREGYTSFVSGGALGLDTQAALAVLRLRARYPITLTLFLPCREQDRYWSAADRRTYREILEASDAFLYLADRYTPACMHERNRCMVDASSAVIAFLREGESTGGTAATVAYAEKTGRRVLFLDV